MAAEQRAGVLVMSAWTDEGELRVRLRWSLGLADPGDGEAVAGSADEAVALARRWLDEIRARGSS
jgi:hypothetical protein